MKYTFTLRKANEPTEREKIVLESRSSESPRHIVLKIISYLLFRPHTAGLPMHIEPADIGQRHRPDLLAVEPITQKPLLWIDCGQIEPKRLGRIAATNNGARIVVVKQTEKEAQLYAAVAKKELPVLGVGSAQFVGYLGFGDGFLQTMIGLLRGANTLCMPSSLGNELSLQMNGETVSTELAVFSSDAKPIPLSHFWEAVTVSKAE